MFEFVVAEHQPISKTVKIAQGKGFRNLELEWKGLPREVAGEVLEMMDLSAMAYYEEDDGGNQIPLRFSDALIDWLQIETTDGYQSVVPRLRAGVIERRQVDIIRDRNAFLRSAITGENYINAAGTELPVLCDGSLLHAWTLVGSDKQPLDFTDPSIYNMVFAENEFFFPIWNSLREALAEMANGKDKEKNSKTSGGSVPRRGIMRA